MKGFCTKINLHLNSFFPSIFKVLSYIPIDGVGRKYLTPIFWGAGDVMEDKSTGGKTQLIDEL